MLQERNRLFDLDKDPKEEHNLAQKSGYRKKLEEMRAEMVGHLEKRGEGWVRDGKLVIRKQKEVYGKNFPEQR